MPDDQRVVITGIGLTSPNGNSLAEFRESLLDGRSGVQPYEIRYVGKTLAGICDFDAMKYQSRKDLRRGTRAGQRGRLLGRMKPLLDSGLDWPNVDPARVGVFLGVTEHGNVETENEIFELKGYDYDTSYLVAPPQSAYGGQQSGGRSGVEPGHYWSALHDRCRLCGGQCRTDPGPADAAIGRVRPGAWRVGFRRAFTRLGFLPVFAARGRWPNTRIRRRPRGRSTCIAMGSSWPKVAVCSSLERLPDARQRGARIYGEIIGHSLNTDATDFVLPNAERQEECIHLALRRAGLRPGAGRRGQHARHRDSQRRQPGVRGAASRLWQFGEDVFQQHQELHWALHGCCRGPGTGRQPAGFRRTTCAIPPSTWTNWIRSAS